ncbi:MAG: hypothetical protein EXR72_01610 [Myxococcales bacterium]|nr:hypothetical protein [Myxococcales bacterium]
MRLVAACLLLCAIPAWADGDAGARADGGAAQGEVPPAEQPPPRAPLGVPRVMATPRASGGPVIELPPEDGGPAPPKGTAASPGASSEVSRTSIFSDLKSKAEAIINRTVLGGYGEFAFVKRQGEDSYFEARRVVAFLHAPIHERISFTTEIEFEHGGSPLKRDGALGAGEVQLEFAAVDLKFFDQFILRGGIILVPFGRFNINHDAPTQDLTDRPLVLTYLIPSTWFEAGAGLLGKQKLPGGVDLTWEAYVVNGFDAKIRDGLGYRAARGSKLQDNNDDKAVVGRLGFYFFGPIGRRTVQIDLGVSGYTGAYDRRGNRANLVGGDLALHVAGFELIAEYVRGFNDPGFDDDYPISTREAVPTALQGLFVEAHYHVMPNALRRRLPSWLRESVFTLAARYDLIDTDRNIKSSGDRQRVTFGLNYRFIEAVVWKHELQLDHVGGAQNPFAKPDLGYVTSLAFLY